MTMLDYQVREDFDDDGSMRDEEEELGFVISAHEAEGWQMNALLGLLAHRSGGKLVLDLRQLREVLGRPLAIHFDLGSNQATLELLPDDAKPVTHSSTSTRQ